MKKVTACALAIFLGSATHAIAAELAEKQWSAPSPSHTAIPEKFGVATRGRFEASENIRTPEVPMPVPPPSHQITPAEAKD
jgi:hypothetical protein